jgi:ABC-2 type transport system permease protein
MPIALSKTLAVAQRVLQQLGHDRRFLGLSLVVPVILIAVLKIFWESLESAFQSPMSPLEGLKPLFENLEMPAEVQRWIGANLAPLLGQPQKPPIEPTQTLVPVAAFTVHLLTYVLCAIGLVRERTAQTLARMFVNGYRQGEVIGGYVLAYTVLATVQSLIVLTELAVLFRLPYGATTFLALYLVIWMLAVTSVALGICLSNFARNEGQVLPFFPVVAIPSLLLSGVIISVDKLPGWAQWLSLATPLYYANAVIQGLIKPGGSLTADWVNLVGLPLYGGVILFLATRTLREVD